MVHTLKISISAPGRPCAPGCVRQAFISPLRSLAQKMGAEIEFPATVGGILESLAAGALQMTTSGHESLDHSSSELIAKRDVTAVENELALGEGVAAVHGFNEALCSLTPDTWEEKLRPVFNEWCYNLESFNPAFTAALLKVQQSIGQSDYFRRDKALKNLIQPLAGEYGMHNGEPQAKTHRKLFCEFYTSLFREPITVLLDQNKRPVASELMYEQMMRDILGGGECDTAIERASYALGYNLAIEYLAQIEKGTMLDSFRKLDQNIFSPAGLDVEWTFLEIHAIDEIEHAAIGHDAVLSFVPKDHLPILRRAALDHNNDFAVFYNKLSSMLK